MQSGALFLLLAVGLVAADNVTKNPKETESEKWDESDEIAPLTKEHKKFGSMFFAPLQKKFGSTLSLRSVSSEAASGEGGSIKKRIASKSRKIFEQLTPRLGRRVKPETSTEPIFFDIQEIPELPTIVKVKPVRPPLPSILLPSTAETPKIVVRPADAPPSPPSAEQVVVRPPRRRKSNASQIKFAREELPSAESVIEEVPEPESVPQGESASSTFSEIMNANFIWRDRHSQEADASQEYLKAKLFVQTKDHFYVLHGESIQAGPNCLHTEAYGLGIYRSAPYDAPEEKEFRANEFKDKEPDVVVMLPTGGYIIIPSVSKYTVVNDVSGKRFSMSFLPSSGFSHDYCPSIKIPPKSTDV